MLKNYNVFEIQGCQWLQNGTTCGSKNSACTPEPNV